MQAEQVWAPRYREAAREFARQDIVQKWPVCLNIVSRVLSGFAGGLNDRCSVTRMAGMGRKRPPGDHNGVKPPNISENRKRLY